jgi:iron complex transport system substrate-binding protein
VLDTITTVGGATGRVPEAAAIVERSRAALDAVASAVAGAARPRTLVLEWTDPAFTAGHWVPDLVTAAGGDPALGRPGGPSVGVGWDEITTSGADVVIVAPCGYGLDAAADLAADVVAAGHLPPGAEVWAVDADGLVVRPGPRLVTGVETFAAILHPDRGIARDPVACRRIA